MKIVRTTIFERALKKLNATPAEITTLEAAIIANPSAGDVISGLGGIRKLRFAMGGKGKRGGGRAIYFVVLADDTIFMLLAYGKADAEDMTPDQKKAVLAMMREVTK